MPNRPNTKSHKTVSIAGLLALCLIGGFLAWRYLAIPPASLLARPRAEMSDPAWHDGAWYWLEGSGKPAARLVRATGSGTADVATDDQMLGFSIGDGKAAWIAGQGGRWSVSVASLNGADKKTLWSGERQPRGICVADRRVFWIEEAPPPIPGYGPLPPLAATIRIVAAPVDGGPLTLIGSLMELRGEQVIGVRDAQLYVVASRPSLGSVTTIYRVPLGGGTSRRVVGETGEQRALLARNGTLYWSAPSRESAQPEKNICFRKLGRDDKPITLQDWIPARGRLYDTDHGPYYVDGGYEPAAWPIVDSQALPTSMPVPAGYTVVAAGGSEFLLQRAGEGANSPLYRMALR